MAVSYLEQCCIILFFAQTGGGGYNLKHKEEVDNLRIAVQC